MQMKKIIFFTSVLYLSLFRLAGTAFAAGENVFEFLKIPATAAQGALAGMTGFNSDSGAHSHAMLDFAPGHSIIASYAAYFQDTSFNSLSFNFVQKKYALNFSYAGFYYGDMDGYRQDDVSGDYISTGKFGANDLALSAGIGFAVFEWLSMGGGLKYVSQTIDSEEISGFAFNMSAVFLPASKWYAVAGLENLGPDVEGGYPMPANGYLGMYSLYKSIHMLAGAELKYYMEGSLFIKAAAEFDWEEKLFLRLGYSYPLSDSNSELGDLLETNLSLGFGAVFKYLAFDFAWMPFGQLGSVSMVTVTINL
jgi:hypothetical protein